MLRRLRRFCRDERGCLFTTEWVFIATILVLGAVSFLAARHVSAQPHGVMSSKHIVE
jgi:hypothetical protein